MSDCTSISEQLLALLYGELEEPAAAALRGHLAGCGDCRAEWEALRGVERMLDSWPAPDAASDAHVLAAAIATRARARSARRARARRAARVGLATAALVLFVLSGLGTRASWSDGALTVELRLPWSSPAGTTATSAGWEERLQAVVRDELAADQSDDDQRLAQVLRAIDRMRAEDRMVYATLIDAAARSAAHEDKKTRAALFELASYVASDQGTVPRNERKPR